MRFVWTGFLLSVTLAAQQVSAPCLERPAANRAYDRVRLLVVVADQTAVRAEYLIRTCGVQIAFTAELESALRKAGAEEAVVRAVRAVAPKTEVPTKPVESKPEVPKAPVEPMRRTVWRNPKDRLLYVWIRPGRFRMGCSEGDSECSGDEKPTHDVRITKGFLMGETEVTQEAYQRVTGTNPSVLQGAKLPVENVTWDEAQAYCKTVGMRLPTEAEWEYAGRAGSEQSRHGEAKQVAWYSENSGNKTHDVGTKQPNGFGLYDMLGNVWEWTADWYKEGFYKLESGQDDPQGPPGGEMRVLRGGSWVVRPRLVRVSNRDWVRPTGRGNDLGFRCRGEIPVP